MLKYQSAGAAAIGALSVLRASTPPLMNGSTEDCSVEKIVDVSLPGDATERLVFRMDMAYHVEKGTAASKSSTKEPGGTRRLWDTARSRAIA